MSRCSRSQVLAAGFVSITALGLAVPAGGSAQPYGGQQYGPPPQNGPQQYGPQQPYGQPQYGQPQYRRPAYPAQRGGELIVNGDAEADQGAPNSSEIVRPRGWRTTGEFTAVQYGASGGFPDASSPGPERRGRNFFAGGNVALSTAVQYIDLGAYGAAIAGGAEHFRFSGWLGGYESQTDSSMARVVFRDASGAPLPGGASLGPVSDKHRHNQTGMLYREMTGTVPAGAKTAEVSIVITRQDGVYNDGSVDNLSLMLQ
jgi:hypothetical protein